MCKGEAQRGELVYYVMSDGKGANPYRVKIRTPSVNNIINTGFMYVGTPYLIYQSYLHPSIHVSPAWRELQ